MGNKQLSQNQNSNINNSYNTNDSAVLNNNFNTEKDKNKNDILEILYERGKYIKLVEIMM